MAYTKLLALESTFCGLNEIVIDIPAPLSWLKSRLLKTLYLKLKTENRGLLQNGVYPLLAENGRRRRPLCCSLRTAATTRSSIASLAASSHFSASGLPLAHPASAAVPYASASCALRTSTGEVASVKSGYAFKYRSRICVSCVAPRNHNPSARHSHTLSVTSCTRDGNPPCSVKSTISSNSCVDKFGRSHNFSGTSKSVGNWFGGALASLSDTCSDASCPA